jgi:putative membrane protein
VPAPGERESIRHGRIAGMGLLLRLAASAVAVWIAALLISGISVEAETIWGTIGTVVAVAAIFGIVNAVLRPIIKTVGCAFYALTLGLIAIVVNALLFLLTGWIARLLDLPFVIENFWPSAVLGALVVGIVSWLLNMVVTDRVR